MSEVKEDGRLSPRKRALKSGRIVFNHRHSVIDCVVRNVSANGARLAGRVLHDIAAGDRFGRSRVA